MDAVQTIILCSISDDLDNDYRKTLRAPVLSYLNIFVRRSFQRPLARVPSLKIGMLPDAKPVRVRLRNYLLGQKNFLADFLSWLIGSKMAYFNQFAALSCAPHHVKKPGPTKYAFKVYLLSIYRFTVKHQLLMPNLEEELTKTAYSKYGAVFDPSHGDLQLTLPKVS